MTARRIIMPDRQLEEGGTAPPDVLPESTAGSWRVEFFKRTGEIFSFEYLEVDEQLGQVIKVRVPHRSLVQWWIMLIGQLIAAITSVVVILIVAQLALGDRIPVLSVIAGIFSGFVQPLNDPVSWSPLGLTMLRLASLGILVLSANAVLEIALLIEEPGVKHVRRVLALSFTGMALYLIKEYPVRHDKDEFLLGCLAGALAALLWILQSISRRLSPGVVNPSVRDD